MESSPSKNESSVESAEANRSLIHRNPSLLLPREEYARAAQEYGPAPLMFEIHNKKQSLFYFGANHSPNPENEQYPVLRDYWKKFLEKNTGEEKIVLVEGGLRRVAATEEEAIRTGSEGSLITLLAHKEGVPIACPDIGSAKLLEALPEQNKEETLLYWFLSWLNNFHKHNPLPDFEKSVETWCEQEKRRGTWAGLEISLPKMRELYEKTLGKPLDEIENPSRLVNPNNTGTLINTIARNQSDLRDTNIVAEIERYWNEGKSIFIVFGSGHLIIERPALEALLK